MGHGIAMSGAILSGSQGWGRDVFEKQNNVNIQGKEVEKEKQKLI